MYYDSTEQFIASFADHVAPTKFGYDATQPKAKRRAPSGVIQSEDLALDSTGRSQVNSDTLDLYRNFSVASWAIRRHLDYTATFSFKAKTKDEGFNTALEEMMGIWQRKDYCDVAGIHPFYRMLRLYEACSVYSGDVGFLKLDWGSLQGIEGDCIRNPLDAQSGWYGAENKRRWSHGIEVNRYGRRLNYGLWARYGNGYEFDQVASARDFIFHGFYHRFNQGRGVSPLTSAVNALKDVYEGLDYALAKVKVSQLFALAIYSDLDDTTGEVYESEPTPTDMDADGEIEEGDEEQAERYSVNLHNGPIKLELENKDRAEFLESKNPSTETLNFLQMCLQIALKSLDIPYNFWDEAYTNFFGSRAAWMIYNRSALTRRLDLQDVLRQITVWLLTVWQKNAALKTGALRLALPRGWTIEDVKFEWVPLGMPWWKPNEELDAELKAIAAGLKDPYTVCKEHGFGDFEDNVLQIKKAQAFAESHGVPLFFGVNPQPRPEGKPKRKAAV